MVRVQPPWKGRSLCDSRDAFAIGCEKFDDDGRHDAHNIPWMMNVVLDKIIQDPPGRPAVF